MIYTITLNPAVDKTIEIDNFEVGTLNRVSSVRLDAGGKGINVSKVILSLGGKSKALGILGGISGKFIKEYLDHYGVDNDFIFMEKDTRTNLKIIDKVRKTNTDINEPGPDVDVKYIDMLKEKLFRILNKDSIVVFSGSTPKNIHKNIYYQWIMSAKDIGAKTILDADDELLKYGVQAGPFLVKPNINELEKLFNTSVKSIKQAVNLARSLINKYGIEIVVVSLGEKGALFLDKTCSIFSRGIKVDVKSTVGAGDAMVAALAHSIDMGLGFDKSVKLAMATATANVLTSGTQPADYSEIAELEKQITFEYIDF
ncbi:MAG TPA: 1-phosphofructokinase [Clostridiaceae bacterium]|nr:1-phosphofructokinase [Clostridiaceae bacterium]